MASSLLRITIVAIVACVGYANLFGISSSSPKAPAPTLMRKMRKEPSKSEEDSLASKDSVKSDTPKQLMRRAKTQADQQTAAVPADGETGKSKQEPKVPGKDQEYYEGLTQARMGQASSFLEQSSVSESAQSTSDTKKTAGVPNPDEDLYEKLFPQEKEAEEQSEGASVLEQQAKPFRIRVPVAGGKRYCLTEEFHGYHVRAEPCRKALYKQQKWYWAGAQLRNLHSDQHCLGLKEAPHGLMRTKQMMKSERVGELQLTMSFKCSDTSKPLHWKIDEMGRLMSSSTSKCMAVKNGIDNFDAMALPCIDAA
jgi:hypothetical protein